ncbi:mitochondrial inner membrane translocase subunit Tim17/Tim22/Tim23/peroxisomal protein PMP24 [Globomyces pollinis-pini]|nr:mitochondrial inner membrane translocase subunit Tim17/Tim22/Tim23/peroxisomal protein PMP24 [Globomyces pollinis-pini]KAJ2993405.1 Mitochondrial import inner membrane translocase subunit tim22 [Globomyces sp. JEL0801]
MEDAEFEFQQKVNQFMFQELITSCPAKATLAVGGGFVLGGVFGLFMSSADTALDDKFLRLTVKEQTKITLKQMGERSLSTAKNFATVGGLIMGTECIVESIRAKDDIYNRIGSGCIAGAVLARHGGIQAMGLGCAGFAAFSAAIETYMHQTRHN